VGIDMQDLHFITKQTKFRRQIKFHCQINRGDQSTINWTTHTHAMTKLFFVTT